MFTSSSNTMTVYFQSDSSNTGPGFTVDYYEVSSIQYARCGGRFDDDSRSFASPNYPRPYPNDAKCTWFITVDDNKRVRLYFIMIQLEVSPYCSNDYIAVYDGPTTNSPTLATICTGSKLKFTSSFNTMTVYFQSDSRNTELGFIADYYEVLPHQNVQCGSHLDDDNRIFTSPNYPRDYPNNARCTWYIIVDDDERVKVNFANIQLEVSPHCSNDYIKIFDGPSTNSPVIATICTGSNHEFTSSSNSMTVYFQSDFRNTAPGFTANYYETSANQNTQCGGNLDDDNGSFTSPNYPLHYPNNAKCIWYISVDNDERIRLNFVKIQLEVSPRCSNDYVTIYDGPSIHSPALSTICIGSNLKFMSSSNKMTVYFQSDSHNTGSGFTAHYHEISMVAGAQCGGNLGHGNGSFASPNYPRNYPNNAKCTWYIFMDSNERIRLGFGEIQLETSPHCSNDYVAIYDGPSTNSPVLATICTGSSHVFISSSNTMTIYFESDSRDTGPGFTAHYYKIPQIENTQCGGKLSGDNGCFTTPNYPRNYPNSATCIWYITMDDDERVKLNFIDIQLEVSSRCSNDNVTIYDGPTTSSPALATICTGLNHEYTSSSNTLTVYFQSDSHNSDHGFAAYYNMVFPNPSMQCGMKLDNNSGCFASPNYPKYYPNNAKCIWNIFVDNGKRIMLKFIDIRITYQWKQLCHTESPTDNPKLAISVIIYMFRIMHQLQKHIRRCKACKHGFGYGKDKK
ncbi:deleted in malignant brain tumors 1 protein-like [Chiloscyllium plagiosum]|uniref:deleted in malignant brain tumors 1 protein-like n=1 Tax=Chiloscyllium plagiosum TaxID=36176 RepID=UPI001CB83C0E|nr:deleted in malignant brain tumors 1 protein-like [Chiloscyllium plagiosum]